MFMPRNCEYQTNVLGIAADAARANGEVPPFARADWFALIAAEGAAADAAHIAHAAVGDAQAWLPLLRGAGGRCHALANWYSFSYGPLFAPADADDRLAALTRIAADLRRRSARVTLAPVSARDGSYDLLVAAFAAAGWRVDAAITGDNHGLDVPAGGFDAYWAARPGALRSTVKRKGAKGRVELTLVNAFDPDLWDAYARIYAQSWKPAEGNPAFLRAFARAEGAAGRLRFGIAHIGGRAVAAQFWTVENGTAFIHKLAHVADSENLSPGTLLTHALMRRVIDDDRVTRVDFGTGDDAYKRDWMNRHDPLWTLDFLNPGRVGSWPAIARAALRRRLKPAKDPA